jgi:ribosomal 50S subunit-recycling heat shock protein
MTKTNDTHHGKVVSVVGNKLTTTCDKGTAQHHTMAKDAKVTCEGQTCKASDLKAGTNVIITTQHDDKTIATAIESVKTSAAPATPAVKA